MVLTDRWANHDYEYTYQMNGTDCKEGYYEIRTCKVCGETEEQYYTYHNQHTVAEYDLAELGVCGGRIYITECPCGYYSNMNWQLDCKYSDNWLSGEDENGIYHDIRLITCETCSLVIKVDCYFGTEGCYSYDYTVYSVMKGEEELIPTYTTKRLRSINHTYEADYVMNGTSCEDGVVATYTCKVCGDSYTEEYKHHETLYTRYELSQYGACGGYIYTYTCACGQENYYEADLRCSTYSEYSDYVDDNGVQHEVYKEICEKCGYTYIRDEYRVEEGCYTIWYRVWTMQIGETVILSNFKTIWSKDAHHNYDYTYKFEKGENCEEGVQILYTCLDCGYEGSYYTSEHEAFLTETVDLSEQGACGAYLEMHVCPCGAREYIELVSDGCEFYSEWQDYEDEDGTYHEVGISVCELCGVVFASDRFFKVEGCYGTWYCNYAVAIGETVLLEYSCVESVEENHDVRYEFELKGDSCDNGYYVIGICKDCGKEVNRGYSSGHQRFTKGEYVFSEYGACEHGSFYIEECPCGERKYLNLDNLCNYNTEREYYVEDGVRHDVTTYTCDDCGLVIVYDYRGVENGCYVDFYRNYTITVGETVLLENYEYYYTRNSAHNYQYSFEFLGENQNCEEGVKVTTSCKDCTDVNSVNEYYYHSTNYLVEKLEFATYGACGGYMALYQCPCGERSNLTLNLDYCNYSYDYVESYKDDNGISHSVYEYNCYDCGLKIIRDEYSKKENCKHMSYQEYTVIMGEETLVSGWKHVYSNGSSHNYGYTFDFHSESQSCEDGYTVYSICKDCGYDGGSYDTYGHNRFRMDYYDLSAYGFCEGSYAYTESCPCGREQYLSWNNYCSYDYNTEYVTDENGVEHSIRTYTCSNCAMQVIRDGYTVEEGCYINSYYAYTFSYDGATIFEFKYIRGRSEDHEYMYTWELNGESCEDGGRYFATCQACGYVYESEFDYHVRLEAETYDLAAYGACGGYIRTYACPCGAETTMDFNVGCSTNHISSNEFVDDNGIQHNVYTYGCRTCGMMYTEDYYTETIGCKRYSYSEYTVMVGETTVLSQFKHYGGYDTVHTYVYSFEMNGESCNDGYYVTTSCAYCDYSYRDYYSYHRNFLKEGYDLATYGACGGYLNYYECPCGYSQSVDWSLYCNYRSETTYEMDANNVRHTITTYTCNTCNVKLVRNVYSVKENCYANTYREYSLTVGETVVVAGLKQLYNTSEAHDYAYSWVMDGESCENGVTITYTCKDCGYSYEYYTTEHYRLVKDHYVLHQYDTCPAYDTYLTYYACPCGYSQYINSNLHGDHTNNQYYDEEGRWMNVDTINCDTCGLRCTDTYYTERDSSICQAVTYHTVLLNVGDVMVATINMQQYNESHDYTISGVLNDGATSCAEGVTITYTCKDCGYSFDDYYTHHYEYKLRDIDLAQYGSVCGGYAEESGCACGYYHNIYINNSLCDFEYQGETMWVENYIPSGWYYVDVDSQDHFSYNSYKYVCAVTDPEQCAFTIRYAAYWLPMQGECKAQQYVTWQFGYDVETKTCQYEYTYAIGSPRTYHPYTRNSMDETYADGSYISGTSLDCPNCGFYRNNWSTYNANGNIIKSEILAEDPNGSMTLYNYVCEYAYRENSYNTYESRRYYRYVYADGSQYWENYAYAYDDSYVAPYGENSYKYTMVYTSSNGTSNRTEEHGYTYVNGSNREVYGYYLYYQGTENEYWQRYDYVWDYNYVAPYGENGYKYTRSYTHSNGASWKEESAYTYLYGYWSEYMVYSYKEEGVYWHRYDYTYSIEKGCERTTVYTDSYGINETTTDSYHRNYGWTTVKNPTCTQDGIEAEYCQICKQYWDESILSPHAHNWIYLEENHYYCRRCGLEGANGASGDIVLEDLTAKYGNNENYVAGYWNCGKVEFIYYVSLILHEPMEDGNDEIVLDFANFFEMTDVRAIYFSISEVEALAAELGYTADQYDVRFAFVPVGSDGSFDYAITFTETEAEVTHITGSIGFVHFIGAGETVEYTVTTDVDSVFTFTTQADHDTYGYLYDVYGNVLTSNDDGGTNNNFYMSYTLKAGETYVLKVRWYSSDQYGDMPIVVTSTPVTEGENSGVNGEVSNDLVGDNDWTTEYSLA